MCDVRSQAGLAVSRAGGRARHRLHVYGQQCAAPARALGLDHGLGQPVQQQAPVGQIGQHIEEGKAFCLVAMRQQFLAGEHRVIGR